MMRLFAIVKLCLLCLCFTSSYKAFSQSDNTTDTSADTSLHNAINIYHQFLSPETGLYNGSEYAYNLYYPFVINEGHPFFETKQFDEGSVFYNNVLYENVPLLYDLVKEELLIKDPTSASIIRINNERVGWFILPGHTFIRLTRDSADAFSINTGFYDLLYKGNSCLYKKFSKIFKENTASSQGINKYVVDVNEYFIMKGNQYYKIKNRKSLLSILSNKKKEIDQFMRKNKLNVKRNKDYALTKIVAYYDGINNDNTKRN